MPRPVNDIEFDIETMELAAKKLETERNATPIFEKCYRDALSRLRADLNQEQNCMLDACDKEAEIHLLRVMLGR